MLHFRSLALETLAAITHIQVDVLLLLLALQRFFVAYIYLTTDLHCLLRRGEREGASCWDLGGGGYSPSELASANSVRRRRRPPQPSAIRLPFLGPFTYEVRTCVCTSRAF